MEIENPRELSPEQHQELLSILKARFEKNMSRHSGLLWKEIQKNWNPITVTAMSSFITTVRHPIMLPAVFVE